ncbi:hypothetical protein ACC691_36040 [Rhizobium johnstonii]|uniref:hypothetical protein n=1 Tax=Rhizobium johnstonii TaxID=3019933 RepID=UPI003F944608
MSYPVVTLAPGENAFEMPPTQGVAHIVVQLQSLFDGSEATIDRDEPYTMGATVTIDADGSLNIELH